MRAVQPRIKASCDFARADGKTRRRRERPAARPGRNFWRNAVRVTALSAPRLREASLPRQRPPPPLSQARCFPGSARPRRRRMSALPQPPEQANTQPSCRRERNARRTLSCGRTGRAASTTTREPAITGTLAKARTCASLRRARPDIAHRAVASRRRALTNQGRAAVQAEREAFGLSSAQA
jgi:hypothetical protein